MRSGIIIAIIIGVIGLGLVYYSFSIENTESQIADIPIVDDAPISEGKNLSISLKESVGVEANP